MNILFCLIYCSEKEVIYEKNYENCESTREKIILKEVKFVMENSTMKKDYNSISGLISVEIPGRVEKTFLEQFNQNSFALVNPVYENLCKNFDYHLFHFYPFDCFTNICMKNFSISLLSFSLFFSFL